MPKQTETNVTPETGSKAAQASLRAARKAKKGILAASKARSRHLAARQRVPVANDWDAKVAKKTRDAFFETVRKSRPDGQLAEHDVLLGNAVYFAACGLSLAYAHLAGIGWIDADKHAFYPLVLDCLKLQNEIATAYRLAGVAEAPKPEDVWDIIHSASQPTPATAAQPAPDEQPPRESSEPSASGQASIVQAAGPEESRDADGPGLPPAGDVPADDVSENHSW
jgi:hypothetical protein